MANLIFIGAMPPPLNGQSLVNQELCAALENKAIICDLPSRNSKPSVIFHFRKSLRVLRAIVIVLLNHHGRVYLSTDGGLGLFYNLLVVTAARIARHAIILHHHSFSFIDARSRVMACVVAVAGRRATHIFPCELMRDRFKSLYAFEGRGLICSNARFVPPKPFSRRQKGARPFCVGLLSNLNAGKGLYDFVALIREAKANNLAVRGLLAGPPTAPADMAAIDAAQRELGSALEYCGALYGSAKDEFYAGLDAFLFPTRYNVESYGLVLIEALAHGVPVIAYSRGCIPSYLAPPAGYSIPITGDFTRKALQQIESWLADPSGHMKAREAAHALGKRLHAAAECTFHELVSAIGANREAAASEIRT